MGTGDPSGFSLNTLFNEANQILFRRQTVLLLEARLSAHSFAQFWI